MHEFVGDFIRENDELAKHLGIHLKEVTPGTAVATMRVERLHLNGVRSAHGGAIFALGDLAFAAASNSHGSVSVGINVSISYFKAPGEGSLLTATAREVARTSRLASYTIEITDDAGDLVALFQGMVYRKKENLRDLVE